MTSPQVSKPTDTQLPTAHSPTADAKGMDFHHALTAIRDGEHVTRLQWQDPEYYSLMHDYHLCLHKPDGKIYSWIISEGDTAGEDWVVLE